jgi:hypothetical protein
MSVPETRVNRQFMLDFFLTFAKFEYALKNCDFYQRRNLNQYDARPDWDRFAVSLRDSFQVDRGDKLCQACKYILDKPPNKQVIINNSVDWQTQERGNNESDIEFILRMVRCIRNNLFHGGKHSTNVNKNIERTEKLLNASSVILKECLNLTPNLKSSFEGAII